MAFGAADVYLNVAGGLRIGEPAADLAVAAALASSASGRPMPPETVVFGEIGLAGEVRAVARAEARLKEATKLGFTGAIVPVRRAGGGTGASPGIRLTEIADVGELVAMVRSAPTANPIKRRAHHG
jgi:DNA repair protein RadA/Sms